MEQKGVQPLRNLLTAMEISRQPSILDSGASAVPNMRFQWHKAAAAAKKLAGIDLLIGVSIYPDPLNNSRNLLGVSKIKKLTHSLPPFLYSRVNDEK